MTRLIASLALCLLFTAVQASNPVFGGYVSSACDSCLDETYQSCPGDYKTRPYATCMCVGDGSANVVTCLSSCDPGLNEPANVSAAWFRYCILFFKDMCPAAKEYIDTETFDKQCSKEAIAAGGIGEKEDDDSGSGKDSDSNSKADAR
ncbi:hypothetical protein NW762_011936 [Fusarium torreyae]|uniref:Uncharacterized protein n=1 Tax=Fusarium torreyae TaxID=1237075 RepID=A0A9W8RQ04_9HYPO|nr:hypothetical protein NW762_011936 [Fusarium torreyae]